MISLISCKHWKASGHNCYFSELSACATHETLQIKRVFNHSATPLTGSAENKSVQYGC